MKPWEELKAEDLMKSPVVSVDEDCALGEAARTMAESQVSGLLVTDQSGAAVGVISLSDIVAYLAGLERATGEPGGFYRLGQPKFEEAEDGEAKEFEAGGDAEEEPLWKTTVDELMAEEIISVPRKAPIPEIAKVLWERRIHRVFVAGPDGPEGVISTMDVLGVLAGMPLAKVGA
jgi:predicted transcriptional regulator